MTKRKSNKLFGTDGIRAAFGDYPLDGQSVFKLGRVLGARLEGSRIVVGRDTRHSGPEIIRLLAAGIGDNAVIEDCGVIPTPGLSYTVQKGGFDYGIMITASHNPWMDNGIKLFGGDGEKIPQTLETELETMFFELDALSGMEAAEACEVETVTEGQRNLYGDYLIQTTQRLNRQKAGTFKIVLDCANGATVETAPRVFRAAGFEPVVIHATPDGKNINLDCGSTMPEGLKRAVVENHAQLGIAFDGDGDRVMMADANGNIIDGDHVLLLLAKYLLEPHNKDRFNNIVVGTVMGNLGLENALKAIGVKYVRTDVGDKYVYREMKASGSIIGGEQSGHTILRAFQKTGDGILTALYFLEALFHFDLSPTAVFGQLELYPQALESFKVKEKPELGQWKELQERIAQFNDTYGADSRILIRYSGTEPKIRVMLESARREVIEENMQPLVDFIKAAIGI